MPTLSEWSLVDPDTGELPEELLPCAYVQYRWIVNHEATPDDMGLGIGSGTFEMQWELALGSLASVDTARFRYTILQDFLFPGLIMLWTYYPEALTTTGPDTTPTFGGDELSWFYDPGMDSGFGITEIFVMGQLWSPVYELSLDVGAAVDVLRHFPCNGVPGPGWMLEVRTAPEGAAEMPLLKDGATEDEQHFRVHRKVLVARRRLSGFDAFEGPQDGLVVAPGSGLSATVSAGWGYVGRMPAELAQEASVAVPASARSYVFAVVDPDAGEATVAQLTIEAHEEGSVPEGASVLLAIVDAGAGSVPPSAVDGEAQGVVVAYDVDAVSGTTEENGRMLLTLDRGSSTGERWASPDKGRTWAQL